MLQMKLQNPCIGWYKTKEQTRSFAVLENEVPILRPKTRESRTFRIIQLCRNRTFQAKL